MIEDALPRGFRRLLDVGSSGGFFLDHCQQRGWQACGIEPSPHAAAFAREHYGLDVFCGDLLDFRLTASSARFDAIHSAQVLEHVLEPEACVARIAELLAPDGVVFIEVPNDFNVFQEVARRQLDKPAWWVAPDHHLNYFDYDSLSSLLARHGLEEVDRVASFPMEMFLLMGDDYVGRPCVGKAAHGRRMAFERTMIEHGRLDELGAFYRALAQAGLGRTCGLLARKR
jgi:SAM-dependent methyltransferase